MKILAKYIYSCGLPTLATTTFLFLLFFSIFFSLILEEETFRLLSIKSFNLVAEHDSEQEIYTQKDLKDWIEGTIGILEVLMLSNLRKGVDCAVM